MACAKHSATVPTAESRSPTGTLRLFFALTLPSDVAQAVAAWAREEIGVLDTVTLIAAGDLHVTLAFLGECPVGEVPGLHEIATQVAARSSRPVLSARAYRETRTVAMLELDDLDGIAGLLERDLSACLEATGTHRAEARPWLAHLTVARFHTRPGLAIQPPASLIFAPPALALYSSRRGDSGHRYDLLASARLPG